MSVPAFGIDLGTTFSSIALYKSGAQLDLISDLGSNPFIPSTVKYRGKDVIVGNTAVKSGGENPKLTVYDSKRMLGHRFRDKEIKEMQDHWPFTVVGDERDQIFIELPGLGPDGEALKLKPYKVSSEILKHLLKVGNQRFPEPIRDCVITVPANFTDAQRAETLKAAEEAGINVLRLLNEPTAAAIAFHLKSQSTGTALIFDFGGGTLDVSLVEISKDRFVVKAVAGDTNLGGRDIDDALLSYILKREGVENIQKRPKVLHRIRQAVSGLKHELSEATTASLYVDNGRGNDEDLDCQVTREQLEEVCAPLFDRILDPVKEVLAWAKIDKSDIDHVVLVGGSSRIPKVQEMLHAFFGKNPYTTGAQEAVVEGAAVMAAKIRASEDVTVKCDLEGISVTDISPLSVGIRCQGDIMEVFMPRGTKFGTKITKEFDLPHNYCTSIVIDVFEGERLLTIYNQLLGSFVLSDIPKAEVGEIKIKVTFLLDDNGILTASASISDECQKTCTIEKKRSRYTAAELAALLSEADTNKEDDEKEVRKRKEYTYFMNLHKSVSEYIKSHRKLFVMILGEEDVDEILEECLSVENTFKLDQIKAGMYERAKCMFQERLKHVLLREGFPAFLE